MNSRNPLSSLRPIESILPLSSHDACLDVGMDNIPSSPRNHEERCLLSHYVIRQATYAGTHILDHLLSTFSGQGIHLAPVLLYRHLLDLGDSIGTLLRFGSSATTAILLRALFESSLGLNFMLEGNTFREDRAASYLTFTRIKRLHDYNIYDPNTSEGKKFHEVLDADSNLQGSNFPRRDHSDDRKQVEDLLGSEESRPFWEKYKQAKRKPKHWYTLCSAATNLRELARITGREAEYLLLYQMLSEPAHGSDVFSGVLRSSPGKGIRVNQIRGPEEKVSEITKFASTYLINCHQLLLLTYVQRDHKLLKWFLGWYVDSYRQFLDLGIGDVCEENK